MSKKKTQEEVVLEIKRLLGDNVLLDLFEYHGRHKKSWFICKEHGPWEALVNNVLKGTGCRKCGIKRSNEAKLSCQDEIEKQILDIHGDNISLQNFKYFGMHKYSSFKCNINEKHKLWCATPDNVINGETGCPECAGRGKTTESVKKDIMNIHSNKLLLDKFKYNAYNENSWFGCSLHNYYWETSPSSIISGQGNCPKCLGKNKTTEEWTKELSETHKDLLFDRFVYNGVKVKSWFGCKLHETPFYFEATPGDIKRAPHGCSKCSGRNKTTEDVKNEIINIKGNGAVILDRFEYNGAKEKSWFGCPIHGYYEAKVNDVKTSKNIGCHKCPGGKGKTEDDIKNEILAIHKDMILNKFKYIGMGKTSVFTCKIHGDFTNIPSHVIDRGQGCPKCAGRNKTTEEVKQEIVDLNKNLNLDKFEYNGSNKDSWFGCSIHGFFENSPNNIKAAKGNGCPSCGGQNRTTEDAKKLIIKKHGNRILLDKFEYNGAEPQSIFGCALFPETHPYWKTSFSNVYNAGTGCPKCIGRNRTTEEAKEMIIGVHGDRINLDRFEYNGSEERSIFSCGLHPDTHEDWSAIFYNVYHNNSGCPKCSSSKGEVEIDRIAKKINLDCKLHPKLRECINIKTGQNLKECKNPKTGYNLRFDFYMQHYNLLGEYDGHQHFSYVNWGSKNITKEISIDSFKEQQCKDESKTDHCTREHIHLLRIHYKDFKKIEEIVLRVIEILSNEEYDKNKNSEIKLFNSTLFINL